MELNEALFLINSTLNVIYQYLGFILPEGKHFSLKFKIGGMSFTDSTRIETALPEYMVKSDDPKKQAFMDKVLKKLGKTEFTMEEGFIILETISLHEAGHILYTDFKEFLNLQQRIATKLEKRGIRRDIGVRIAAQLFNCIEDGRIEKRLVNTYDVLHKFWLKNGTVWKLNDTKPESELQTFLNSVVSIAVTGLYPKYFKDLEGTEVDTEIKKIRPYILEAIDSPTCKICSRRTEAIYDMVEDYLVKILEVDQKALEDFEEMIQEMSESPDFHNTEEHESGEMESDISSHLPMPKKEGEKSSETSSSSEKSESGEESEGESGKGKGKSGDAEDESEEKKEGEGESSKDDATEEKSKGSEGKETPEEGSSSPAGDDSERGVDSGTKKQNPEAPPEEDFINKALEEALEKGKAEASQKMKQEPKDSKKESAETGLTKEDIKDLKEGHYDKERLNDFKEVKRTCNLIPLPQELRMQANQFRKEVDKFFKNQGQDLHRMDSGKLTSKHLHKLGMKEYNIFTKVGHKTQTDAVINVIWDGSGSMHGNKQIHSTNACSIIEEGLKGIIPLKISNFSVDWDDNKVVHYQVKDFDENSKQHNYSQSYGRSKGFTGGNKDGYSIRVATKELLKRPERDRILVMMSDGLPSDYNNMSFAVEDVKNAVKEARAKGIYVVSMFFGSEGFREAEADTYSYMYQKNIINASPQELPKRLVEVFKKLVLR